VPQLRMFAEMVERMNEIYLLISVKKILNWIFRCTPIGSDSWSCQCLSGYTGANCETVVSSKRKMLYFLSKKFIFFYLGNICLPGSTTCLNGGR